MKRIDFNLPIFDWDITIVTIYDTNDEVPLRNLLIDMEATEEDMKYDLNSVRNRGINGGDTWRDYERRKILVIIFPWSTLANFYKTLNHEKRHVVDRICEHHLIKDRETPAYIDGYISSIIYSRINEIT